MKRNTEEELKEELEMVKNVEELYDNTDKEKPTEITVDKPEYTEEDVDKTPVQVKQDKIEKTIEETYNEILKKGKEEFDKMVLEEGFDPEHDVEYEDEDKLYPVLKAEDIEVFKSITTDIFDQESMDMVDTFVSTARDDIAEFVNFKKNQEAGLLDKEDMEYFSYLTERCNESRRFLIVLQKECRKIQNKFEDDHVAEETIRVIVFNSITEYIRDKFKGTDSWITDKSKPTDVNNRDDEICKNIKYATHAPVLFSEWTYRSITKSKYGGYDYNMFSPKQYNKSLDILVLAISTYIKHGNTDKTSINISKIIEKDFKNANFINSVVAYTIANKLPQYVRKEEDITKLKEFKKILAPFEKQEEMIENIATNIELFINYVYDSYKKEGKVNNFSKLQDIYLNNFMSDPLYKTMDKENLNLDDVKEISKRTSDLIPDLNDVSIVKWGKSYNFIQKYVFYLLFKQLNTFMVDETKSEKELKKYIFFNFFTPLMEHYFISMYTDIITDIDNSVRFNFMKDIRNNMFGSLINNLILQHELAFKLPMENEADWYTMNDEDEMVFNTEKLYEEAKKVFNTHYNNMVSYDRNEDYYLKDVNLGTSKCIYLYTVFTAILNMHDDLYFVNDNFDKFEKHLNPPEEPKKKKSNKKKHRK